MFKPKPQQQKPEEPKNVRRPADTQAPTVKILTFMFEEAQMRRGLTVEQPWSENGKQYLLMVMWEKGVEFPAWTLYEEGAGESSMLFSQSFPPNDIAFVYEMIQMSTASSAQKTAPAFIPDELRPTGEPEPIEEVKKPDDIWKSRVEESLGRSTQSGMPSQVYPEPYPEPLPREQAPPPPPPAPPPPPPPPPPPQPMAPPMPPQPGYGGYGQPQPQPMAPQGYGGYQGMPGQPYPQQMPPQPQYQQAPPQPYPQQMSPPGYPQQGQYAQQQQPPGGWPYPQQQAPMQQQQVPTSSGPGPVPIDMSLIAKRSEVTLASILVESGLLTSHSLDAAMKLQEMVEDKNLSTRDAARVLAKHHSKGAGIEQYVAQTLREMNDLPSDRAGQSAPQQGNMIPVKEILDLLVKAGVITPNDINTANEVRKKHGGDMSKILAAAGKVDEKTFEAAVICLPLIRDGKMPVEQCMIALQYCSRMRVSFDDAVAEMNWPNPRHK